jgi:hypothetical protein
MKAGGSANAERMWRVNSLYELPFGDTTRGNRMSNLPIRRVVLYKHGVAYFERETSIEGEQSLSVSFKQREVSDVLKLLAAPFPYWTENQL